jgi:hypothetical protein
VLSARILCCAEVDQGNMREPSVESVPSSAKFPIARDAQEPICAVWSVWGSLYPGLRGWLFTVRASKIETFVEGAAMAATCVWPALWLVLRRFNNHKTKT